MIYQVLKCILSQITDLFNGQTEYYLNIFTFNMSLNIPYITIYMTIMFINLGSGSLTRDIAEGYVVRLITME